MDLLCSAYYQFYHFQRLRHVVGKVYCNFLMKLPQSMP